MNFCCKSANLYNEGFGLICHNLNSVAAGEKTLFQGILRDLWIVYVHLELVKFITQSLLSFTEF